MMVYVYILVMALVTYLIRVIPLTVFRKKIENRYIKSFLYYVPYTCLTAMTFPAILYATANIWSALAGVIVAVILAFRNKSLVTVAAFACVAVFFVEQLQAFL
jgi:branched-subunit amino acid transport protein